MGHRADGNQVELVRQVDIGGALEELRQYLVQRAHDFLLPSAGEAPAHAEVKELEGMALHRLCFERAQLGQLHLQPGAAGADGRGLVEASEVEFVDDRQHVDLEAHHMHLRAAGEDLQCLAVGARLNEAALKPEDAQEVHEAGLDVAQAAEVDELVLGWLEVRTEPGPQCSAVRRTPRPGSCSRSGA